MPLIDPILLQTRLATAAGRFDVDAVDACDSTNSELLRRAEAGAPSGSVLVADRQSAGRGRRGRNWLSAPASSLTFSVLWRFPGPATRLAGLSLAVGVALARALAGLGARSIRLKWPNDVLLERGGEFAKLAGILVELASDRRGTQAVIGIGLNLAAPTEEFDQPAAGLGQAMETVPDRHEVLAAILRELQVALDAFAVDGFRGLKMAWQDLNAWAGLPVTVAEGATTLLAGRCVGVDDDGALLIDTGRGVETVLSGDVSLRRG